MKREELLQVAKPILFNTDIVRAILEGKKTQTRRVIKPQPRSDLRMFSTYTAEPNIIAEYTDDEHNLFKPRYKTGDILYVRETWQYLEGTNGAGYAYKAGGGAYNDTGEWRPSIHMPKFAARIFLRVTDVRVERLQDITLKDVFKEGVDGHIDKYTPYKFVETTDEIIPQRFIDIWNSISAKRDGEAYSWDSNPWVWVYEFEKIEVIKNERMFHAR